MSKLVQMSLNDIPVSTDVKEFFDPAKILESCRVNPLEVIEAPPIMVRIGESPALTAGNFSLLIGKAKSRKTFLQSAITAAAVCGGTTLGQVTGMLPEDQKTVLLFDTEQSSYHLSKTVRRICQMAAIPNPPYFNAVGLRKFTPAERVAVIEYAINHTPGVGFIVIDGLRDLLSKGINDEEEATAIVSKLLRWTAEKNVHILLVLHQNKADMNARGHVGTEAVNKAETVISVTVGEDKATSKVEAEFSRDKSFTGFAFSINDDGLPLECDFPTSEKKNLKVYPDLFEDNKHFEILTAIYRKEAQANYNELIDQIITQFGKKGIRFGESKCRSFIAYYLENKWIEKVKDGKNVLYQYKRAIF